MTTTEPFTQSTGAIARAAGITSVPVRLYADMGLVPFLRASNGTRLFQASAVEQVKAIYLRRCAYPRKSAAAPAVSSQLKAAA